MFPREWKASKVVEEILESMENTKKIEYSNGCRYTHIGKTSEGLEIFTVVEFNERSAQVISAYPNFKGN